MTDFEKAVVREIKRIRDILQTNETLHQFKFEVSASGRVHDGEVKIVFSLGEYSASIEANSVNAAISEFNRRKGFETVNSGLVLTGPGKVENTDDIPL